MGLLAEPPNSESRYWDKGSLLPVSGSLIARKFSLLRRLGNSVAKRLNFPSKAEALWLSQKRKWRISLYFPRPDLAWPLADHDGWATSGGRMDRCDMRATRGTFLGKFRTER